MNTADRKFTYESINEYYTTKFSKFGSGDLLLDDDETIGTIRDNEQLVVYFNDRAGSYKLDLPDCNTKPYTWLQLIEDPTYDDNKRIKLLKFRDFVFCTIMLWIGSHMPISDARHMPQSSEFDIKNNMFTVIGSQSFISDIDVTIQGPHAWAIIANLEDLYVYLFNNGISIKCWDIEFYGDFRILGDIYLNVKRFSDDNMLKILKYAYVSYFRSTHITDIKDTSSLARTLGLIYLKEVGIEGTSLDEILKEAFGIWEVAYNMMSSDESREMFYKQSRHVEELSTSIKSTLVKKNGKQISNNTRIVNKDLAPSVFFALAEGNIHRPESYILPSTAVHVVEMEQLGKHNAKNSSKIPLSWFSNNARIELNEAVYIASAIEQVGYIEHYHSSKITCLKKGVKYFGRLIRAFEYSGLLEAYSEFKFMYKELNAYRKGTNGVDPNLCDTTNIHNLLSYFNEYLKFHILEDTKQQNALNSAKKIIGRKYYAAAQFERSGNMQRRRINNTVKRASTAFLRPFNSKRGSIAVGVEGGRRLRFKKTLKRRKY